MMAIKYFEKEGAKSSGEATGAEVKEGFYNADVPEPSRFDKMMTPSDAHEDIGFCGDRLTMGRDKI